MEPVRELREIPPARSLTLVQGEIAGGWVLDDTQVVTDEEIFGFVKQRRLTTKRPVSHHRLLLEIKPGDYVVHIEHGIGRFKGIITRGPTVVPGNISFCPTPPATSCTCHRTRSTGLSAMSALRNRHRR